MARSHLCQPAQVTSPRKGQSLAHLVRALESAGIHGFPSGSLLWRSGDVSLRVPRLIEAEKH
jgi:hypothetical protein